MLMDDNCFDGGKTSFIKLTVPLSSRSSTFSWAESIRFIILLWETEVFWNNDAEKSQRFLLVNLYSGPSNENFLSIKFMKISASTKFSHLKV